MALRVVGAGLGRTGTHSLKLALEQLLDGPCYHMTELFPRPQHIPVWHQAMKGQPVDWDALFEGFKATVDWPGAAVWDQLHDAYPDAVVLLSVRESAEVWWNSFSQTILAVMQRGAPGGQPDDPWFAMSETMMEQFSPDGLDRGPVLAAYHAHNERVRASVPSGRLVEWEPGQGWGPLCAGLGLPEPENPFPHVNTTDDFRAMTGLDPRS
ncbi:MAG TPA: sulfotransferase [Acidimicrobiales bacterium]|nr:sulfotransferase [Acidimicrobiales bacterium]